MTTRPIVYIAGPMTLGDSFGHVGHACRVWIQLWRAGFFPIAPQWSAVQAMVSPLTLEEWMEYDLPLVRASAAVLRIPGESRGADIECQEARHHRIPIYHTIDSLITDLRAGRFHNRTSGSETDLDPISCGVRHQDG
jgi:hypothetical protein